MRDVRVLADADYKITAAKWNIDLLLLFRNQKVVSVRVLDMVRSFKNQPTTKPITNG